MELQSFEPLMPALVMSAVDAAFVAYGLKQLHSMRQRPDGRVWGQRVAIVAAESPTDQDELRQALFACEAFRQAGVAVPALSVLDVSGLQGFVVATARVASFSTLNELRGELQDAWFSGGYGWHLTDVQPVRPLRVSASVLVVRGLAMLRANVTVRLGEVN